MQVKTTVWTQPFFASWCKFEEEDGGRRRKKEVEVSRLAVEWLDRVVINKP